MYLENGKIKVDLVSPQFDRLTLDNYQMNYNDGLWHTVEMSIRTNELILTVDKIPMKTTRLLQVKTGLYYYIAGMFFFLFVNFYL